MSVIKEKRQPSNVEFINKAYEIEVEIENISIRVPQRRSQHIFARIEQLSFNILENVRKGNTVFVNCKEDYFRRRQYMQSALEDTNALITQLSVAQEVFLSKLPKEKQVKDSTWGSLITKVTEEIKLLTEIIKTDYNRFKNFQSYLDSPGN